MVYLPLKFRIIMNKFVLITVTFLVSFSTVLASEDWGKTGHRAIGAIAEKHLSKKAQKEITKLLNGQSLALVANYGDDIKSDRTYNHYGPWHYVNFPFGGKYETYPKSEKGDIIQGIGKCIAVLKDEKYTSEEKVFHLKLLVHFVGDLHQPLHIGVEEDKGGNDFQVQWFKSGTNLHTVWDSKMLDSYAMSYTELTANTNVLSKEEIENIKRGTLIDWMYDSREICEKIYANTEIGQKLGYNYMYEFMDILRHQLQKGGIRLATLLNDIFR